MANLATLNPDRKLRCMAVGYYKTGKTSGALTFPRPNVLDFDKGTDVGLSKWWREKFGIDPAVIQYERFQERKLSPRGVPISHNAYDDAMKYFDLSMSKDRVDTFDSWIIDSGTTLGEAARNKAIVLFGGTTMSAKPLSQTHRQAMETGMVNPKIQDYQGERSLLEQFIDTVLSTDKHVVLVCHAKDEYEGEGDQAKVVGVVPLLTGQSVQRVCLKFNEIYWIEMRKDGPVADSKIFTSPDSRIKRGSRYGVSDLTSWNWKSLTTELANQGFYFAQGAVAAPSSSPSDLSPRASALTTGA